MSLLGRALAGPHAIRVGLALLHFLWQGGLIAAALAFVLRLLRRGSPDARYAAATVALMLMAATPVVTLLSSRASESVAAPSLTAGNAIQRPATPAARLGGSEGTAPPVQAPAGVAVRIPAARSSQWVERAAAGVRRRLPLVVAAWLAGVLLLAVWRTAGWVQVRRLTGRGTCDVAHGLQERLTAMARRLRMSAPVRAVESAVAAVPMVVGCLRPVVVVPACVMTGLTPEQLDALLAHELAHIRRHDHLVNAVQIVIETLLFYHPAVWWTSRRMRLEREYCCDDLAAAVCRDRAVYARALTALEELRCTSVVAASGGNLLARILRILDAPSRERIGSPRWLPGAAASVVVGLLVIASVPQRFSHGVSRIPTAAGGALDALSEPRAAVASPEAALRYAPADAKAILSVDMDKLRGSWLLPGPSPWPEIQDALGLSFLGTSASALPFSFTWSSTEGEESELGAILARVGVRADHIRQVVFYGLTDSLYGDAQTGGAVARGFLPTVSVLVVHGAPEGTLEAALDMLAGEEREVAPGFAACRLPEGVWMCPAGQGDLLVADNLEKVASLAQAGLGPPAADQRLIWGLGRHATCAVRVAMVNPASGMLPLDAWSVELPASVRALSAVALGMDCTIQGLDLTATTDMGEATGATEATRQLSSMLSEFAGRLSTGGGGGRGMTQVALRVLERVHVSADGTEVHARADVTRAELQQLVVYGTIAMARSFISAAD